MWRREFSNDFEVPEQILNLVKEGKLRDGSWHNDVCPAFYSDDEEGVMIWSDHPDPDQRELPYNRFSVCYFTEGCIIGETIICTESIKEVLAVLIPLLDEE